MLFRSKRGCVDTEELGLKMTAFARQFPSLRNAPGVDPWQPDTLDHWAAGPASHGERLTALFLLAVWEQDAERKAGYFDVMEALRMWDFTHRETFLDWAADPWWA